MDRLPRFTIDFRLSAPTLPDAVEVRMSRVGERWVAQADVGGGPRMALGGSARGALVAALEPLGTRAVTLMLADLALLEPSCAILEAERSAARGA